jgi:abelson tyrosine-protein kinase 1
MSTQKHSRSSSAPAPPPSPNRPLLPHHASSSSSSDFNSVVRKSSPLNPSSPSSTPTKKPSALPESDASNNTLSPSTPPLFRPRGKSVSTLRDKSPSGAPISRVVSNDSPGRSYRDRSPGRIETPPLKPTTSTWWSTGEVVPRPWRDPKRKKTVPSEQTEGWVHTKEVSWVAKLCHV